MVVWMSDEYPAALIREIVADRLHVEGNHLDRHAGRVSGELAKTLSFRKAAWDRDPEAVGAFEETDRWRTAVGIAETARTSEAIAADPSRVIAFETGVVERDLSARHLTELSALYGLVRNAGSILNLCGGTDHGKTNVAWLAIGTKVEVEPETLIVANVPESDIDLPAGWSYRPVEDIADVEFVAELEPDRPKVVLVDDASIDHSAHSSSGDVEQRQGRLARLAAKLNMVLIYVGHRDDGLDLAKHVRAMPGTKHLHAVRIDDPDGTTDRYVCSVYDSLDDGKLTDLSLSLDPLPRSPVTYDPDAVAHALFAED